MAGTRPRSASLPLLIAVLPESVRFLVLRGGQGAGIARILSRIGGTRVPANASFELIEPAVQARHSARSLFSGGFAVLTSRLWLSYFMGLLIIYLLTGWLPTLMRDAGFSIERAAFITGIFQIGGSVGSVGIGYVMDRVDRRRVVGASYAIGAVCVLLLGFLAISPGLFSVVLLLCGIFLSGAQTGMNALAPMSYPTAMRATGASWMLGIGRCGGITGSLIGGPLLAMGLSSGNLFSLLAVPAAVAAAGMLDARLELFASQPRALSSFYASTFGLAPRTLGESITCSAPGRALVLIPGEGGQLRRACFRFARRASFHAHRELLIARGLVLLEDLPGGFTVCDPEGRQISFLAPTDSVRAAPAATLEARLQHFGCARPRLPRSRTTTSAPSASCSRTACSMRTANSRPPFCAPMPNTIRWRSSGRRRSASITSRARRRAGISCANGPTTWPRPASIWPGASADTGRATTAS